jgi:hypothetical protein
MRKRGGEWLSVLRVLFLPLFLPLFLALFFPQLLLDDDGFFRELFGCEVCGLEELVEVAEVLKVLEVLAVLPPPSNLPMLMGFAVDGLDMLKLDNRSKRLEIVDWPPRPSLP